MFSTVMTSMQRICEWQMAIKKIEKRGEEKR